MFITKNENRNENMINYHIIAIDKHFIYNYHYYCEIDKKELLIVRLTIILLLLFIKLLILI